MHRPELLDQVAGMLVAGAAHRQIARHLGCSHSTVGRIARKLGQQAALFHEVATQEIEVREPVVFDHFETFVRSQQERLAIGTAVGRDSWFVYDLRGARHRGSSRRSRRKPALKQPPKPPTPGAVIDSTRKTLESLLRKSPGGLDLVTDDHPAYRAAIGRLNAAPIRHTVYANPKSIETSDDRSRARARHRAMFAADLLHKILRHTHSHQRRETIAFGRKTSNVIGRTRLFAVWRNFIKHVTERRPCRETPAIRLGLTDRRWAWRDVFAERLFERRVAASSP